MGKATIIPVLMHQTESISHLREEVRERIKLYFTAQLHGEDLVVEVMLPETKLHNIAVHIAPGKFVLTADSGETGIPVCQVIDLPLDTASDGVDAEQHGSMVRIIAPLAWPEDAPAGKRDSEV